MQEDALRDALARVAGAVSVLATRDGDGYRGLTLTSLTSVSLEPPLVLVSLDRLAQTRDLVLESGGFSVSVLSRAHDFLADRFSGRAPVVDRSWREVSHFLTPGGLPVLEGSLAWFECRVAQVHEAGDHDLVVGAVEACGTGPGDPLLLWDREFWGLG